MKFIFVIMSLISTTFFLSCSSYQNERYLAFDNVVFIRDFPCNIQLDKVSPIDVDLMGSVDMISKDSIVIFKYLNMDYYWKVFSLNTFKSKGEYLFHGIGPDEFTNLSSNEYFSNDGNVCQFWDPNQKKMYCIDMKKTLDNCVLNIDTVINLPIKSYTPNCIQIDDSLYFVVQGNGDSYYRSIFVNDKIHELEYLKPLNNVKIQNDINSISGVRVCNKSKGIIVEGMLHLNQINLYSMYSSAISKTICVGEELSNVIEVDNTQKKQWTKYYGSIITDDNYFAILYYNTSRKNFFLGKMDKVDIQFFNWDGEPLLNVSVPYSVTSFFINQNKYLYVLSTNAEAELLYKYDISSVLRTVLEKNGLVE